MRTVAHIRRATLAAAARIRPLKICTASSLVHGARARVGSGAPLGSACSASVCIIRHDDRCLVGLHRHRRHPLAGSADRPGAPGTPRVGAGASRCADSGPRDSSSRRTSAVRQRRHPLSGLCPQASTPGTSPVRPDDRRAGAACCGMHHRHSMRPADCLARHSPSAPRRAGRLRGRASMASFARTGESTAGIAGNPPVGSADRLSTPVAAPRLRRA